MPAPFFSRDLVLGLLLAAYCLFMAFIGIPYGIDAPEEVANPALSPRLWPDLIIAFSGLLAILMLLRAILAKRDQAKDEPKELLPPVEEGGAVDPTMEWQGRLGFVRTIIGMAMLALAYPVLSVLGLLFGSIVLVAAFSLLYRERHWLALAGCAIGIPLVCYLFFEKVASIPIPMGVMTFLEG